MISLGLLRVKQTHNPLVVGSSPTGPTKLKAAHCAAFVFLAFETNAAPIQTNVPRDLLIV